MGKQIGLITEVKGIKVRCKLFELLPPFLIENGIIIQAPKINTLVKTKVGIDTIICQVNGEISSETDGRIHDHYLELDVKGFIENGKFIQGLRLLPIVAATVELLDLDDFKIIYQVNESTSIMLGNDIFDTDKKIAVNINHLMPSHIGIFGNTGSGKSNTLAKIMAEYSNFLVNNQNKNSKLVLFDLNNEYGKDSFTSINNKILYSLKTRTKTGDKIPFDFSKLTEDDFVVILNASEKVQTPVVKHAFKNAYNSPKDETYYRNFIKNALMNSRRSMFNSLRTQLDDYISNLDNFYFHTGKDQLKFYYQDEYGNRFFDSDQRFKEEIDNIEINIPEDKLDRFLFELCFAIARENENGTNIDFIIGLLNRASKIFDDIKRVFDFSKNESSNIFGGKEIAIVQLANVNNDMKELIPSLLASVIFNDSVDIKGDNELKSITSIVIDEAHNLLYDEKNNVFHDNTIKVFEKVIKEGRKFGVFVYIASQRPSDISSTILSQLHNYFIHKLVNPSDLNAIKKTVAFLDEKALDFLTVLSPGECIVSGVAFQMPRFLYVEQLDKPKRPNSENIILVGENGVFNSIGREDAFKIWEMVNGEKQKSIDCFGCYIIKEDYEDSERTRKSDDGKEYTYAWTIVFKKPAVYGGKFKLDNLQIVHFNFKEEMRNKLEFTIQEKKYKVKTNKKGLSRIIDVSSKKPIDISFNEDSKRELDEIFNFEFEKDEL